MKDLVFTCNGTDNKSFYCAYNTIMDFLDEVEEKRIQEGVVNGSHFKATFFENELNTFACDTLELLYKHCKAIIR